VESFGQYDLVVFLLVVLSIYILCSAGVVGVARIHDLGYPFLLCQLSSPGFSITYLLQLLKFVCTLLSAVLQKWPGGHKWQPNLALFFLL